MANFEDELTKRLVRTKDAQTNINYPLVGGFSGDPLRGGKGASPFLKQFKPDDVDYNAKEVLKAGFEKENATYNFINSAFNQHIGDWDEDYNPFNEIIGTKYEAYKDSFVLAYNPQDSQRIKDKIDKEEYNNEILQNSGGLGVVASILGGTLDLVNLIPVGGVAYRVSKGGKVLAGAVAGATGGLASATAAESVLQTTQETRTTQESVFNIAGATILGGILGGAAGQISNMKFNKMARKLEKEFQPESKAIEKVDLENKSLEMKEGFEGKIDEFGFINREGSASAAFNYEGSFKARFEELGFGGGKAAQAAFQATKKINPMLRIFDDPIAHSKEVMLKLVRTNLQTKGVKEGIEKPVAVETSQTRYQGYLGRSIEANKKIFMAASDNKATAFFGKGYKKFNEEVSNAIIDGGHKNPEIQKASQIFVDEVFQQIGKEANDVGLFTNNVEIAKKRNYFPRFYKTNEIIAKSDDFKKLLFEKGKERLIPSIKKEFNAKQETLISQIAEINARKDELDNLLGKPTEGKIQMSEQEQFAILDKYKQASKDLRTIKPKSLFQFIKENGGIQDSGGELSSRELSKRGVGLVKKDRIQTQRSKDGQKQIDISMDKVAERAWKAGYFPEFTQKPSINDLLSKIDEELIGNKVFSEFDLDNLQIKEDAQDFMSWVNKQGIDLDNIKTRDNLTQVLPELSKRELNSLKAKKTRLEKKFDKVKEEYEDLFGKSKDSNEVVRFIDGTSKTRGQIAEDNYLKEIVDNIFNKIRKIDNQIALPYGLKVGVRGPAKSRTLNFVTDKELKPWIEKDITEVASRYVRSLSGDIEIKKRFGDLNLKDDFNKIDKEYDFLESKSKTEKERLNLNKKRKETKKIIEIFKDNIRGTYQSTRDFDSWFAQAGQTLRNTQYLSKMGGVTASSFADVSQPIFKHGLGRFLKAGIQKLITDRSGAAKITQTNKMGGQGFELALSSRVTSMFDLNNPYSNKSSFSNFLDTMTSNFSNLNLMNFWNNLVKDFSGFMTHQRIIESVNNYFTKIKPIDKEYLSNLGIGQSNIEDISKQLKKYGGKDGSILLPNLDKWDNIEAKNLYIDAVNLDIDSTIVTKGVGDIPLWMNTEWGKTLGQFKSFAFAANQQVFLAGLQRSDTAALTGMISLISAGMLVYYMKTSISDRDLSDDPAVWLIEGIDRSGINPIMMEANGILEIFGVGASKGVGGQKLSRYATRNKVSSLGGPTLGMLQDIGQAGAGALSGEMTEGDKKAARRQLPYQNLIWLRLLENQLNKN